MPIFRAARNNGVNGMICVFWVCRFPNGEKRGGIVGVAFLAYGRFPYCSFAGFPHYATPSFCLAVCAATDEAKRPKQKNQKTKKPKGKKVENE